MASCYLLAAATTRLSLPINYAAVCVCTSIAWLSMGLHQRADADSESCRAYLVSRGHSHRTDACGVVTRHRLPATIEA